MKKLLLGLLLLSSCSTQSNSVFSSTSVGANEGVLLHHYSTLCEDAIVNIYRMGVGAPYIEFVGRSSYIEEAPEYCVQSIDLTVKETIIEVNRVYSQSTIKFVFDRNQYYFLIEDRR